MIHARFAEQETKHKAGNAKGCIRRFLFEAEDGDVVVVNGADGTMLAVFDGQPACSLMMHLNETLTETTRSSGTSDSCARTAKSSHSTIAASPSR